MTDILHLVTTTSFCLLLQKHMHLQLNWIFLQAVEDDELLLLILKCGVISDIVNTPYYSLLVTYILSNQDPGKDTPYYLNVDNVVGQLQEAGFEAEAGSLLLQYRGTHPSLRTFDAALGFLSRWLPGAK